MKTLYMSYGEEEYPVYSVEEVPKFYSRPIQFTDEEAAFILATIENYNKVQDLLAEKSKSAP